MKHPFPKISTQSKSKTPNKNFFLTIPKPIQIKFIIYLLQIIKNQSSNITKEIKKPPTTHIIKPKPILISLSKPNNQNIPQPC